jgi:hypothetical protein
MINVFAGKPNLVIALQDRGFLDSGITAMNTTIIHKLGNTPLTFNPNEELNAISSFEKDQPYVIYCSQNIDLTGIVENQIPAGIEITPGINVLANSLFAGIALQTISFATMGLDATKITDIVEVGQSFKSYVPGDSINAIEGTIEGMPYYGHALVDMDLSAYFIPPIVIPSDVETPTDTYKYYGTEATSDKGYWNVPVRWADDEATLFATTGIENIVYVAKLEKTSWYWDGSAYQQIGGGTGTSYTFSDSLNEVAGTVNLHGDSATPGNSKYYGTDGAGAKGFYALPATGITSETDPTVPTLVKNIPVSADAAINKYLNWDGTQYVRKQIDYSEITGTAPSGAAHGIDDVLAVGQALTAVRTIAAGTNRLDMTGSNSSGVLKATSSSGAGSSAAVVGIGTAAIGVSGTSSTGSGGSFSSTSGIAISGTSNSNIAVQGLVNSATTNTQIDVIDVRRQTTGTAANEIGGRISYNTETSNGTVAASNYLISKWTDATTATITSRWEVWGRNNGASAAKIFSIGGQGFMQLEPISATAASAITASDGMIVYVNTTDATFTAVGFWKRENGTWIKF